MEPTPNPAQALPETFEIPSDVREAVEAIRDKYRMAIAFQMADELIDAGLSMELSFHIIIADLRAATARLVWMACAIEKRQPRRDLWIRRAEEDLDIAKEWFDALPRQEAETDPAASATEQEGGSDA